MQAEDGLMPDVFVPEKRVQPDSDRDSLDSESDSEPDEIPQPKQAVIFRARSDQRAYLFLGQN
jgi:hypothetical protein